MGAIDILEAIRAAGLDLSVSGENLASYPQCRKGQSTNLT